MFAKYFGICVVLFTLLFSVRAAAQHAVNDSILMGATIENGDTLPMAFLPEFMLVGQRPATVAHEPVDENLRYNVYKVYPYAVIAAQLLQNVDDDLARLPDRQARKAYLKQKEKELNGRFKGELKDLSIQQGQILVKLIDRQTGKNCYGIIKELKGGFSAVIWQSVALLFNNNLKREYDPTDRDKEIERYVKEVEAYYYYKSQQASRRPAIR